MLWKLWVFSPKSQFWPTVRLLRFYFSPIWNNSSRSRSSSRNLNRRGTTSVDESPKMIFVICLHYTGCSSLYHENIYFTINTTLLTPVVEIPSDLKQPVQQYLLTQIVCVTRVWPPDRAVVIYNQFLN